MDNNLFNGSIALAVLVIAVRVFLSFQKEIFAFLRARTTDSQFKTLVNIANLAVRAVEQISFNAVSNGQPMSSQQKYSFAARRIKEMLQSRGITSPSEADLENLIEGAVAEFNKNPFALLNEELGDIKVEG